MECSQQCYTKLHALQAIVNLKVTLTVTYTVKSPGRWSSKSPCNITLQGTQQVSSLEITLNKCTSVILPSSGAELSAELSLSELPEEAALFICFFMAPFFSALPAFPFFLFLEPPTVHCKERNQ